MYAQRNARNASRPAGRRPSYAPPAIRARIGLLMRKGSNFASMEDAERTVRASGLGLAPVSTGEPSMSDGGMTILATASMGDLDTGVLRALVVPDGSDDQAEAGKAAARAIKAGLPVIAFGDSIDAVANAAGVRSVESPAAMFSGGDARAISDTKALTSAADTIR